jgi:hypothetical protein
MKCRGSASVAKTGAGIGVAAPAPGVNLLKMLNEASDFHNKKVVKNHYRSLGTGTGASNQMHFI